MRPVHVSTLLLLAATGAACSAAETTDSAASTTAASAEPSRSKPKWAMPTGPMLAIEAGKGVGPIRIGATVATIERLMQLPCEVKSENLCRYARRGVDFHLVNGFTDWIHVQRAGRPAGRNFEGEAVEFGFFNGGIPPDLRLGMVPEAIQQYLGKPERIEHVPQPNPLGLEQRHYYPGLVVEYDRYSTGKLILGGVRIVRDPRLAATALPNAAATASAAPVPARAASAAPVPARAASATPVPSTTIGAGVPHAAATAAVPSAKPESPTPPKRKPSGAAAHKSEADDIF